MKTNGIQNKLNYIQVNLNAPKNLYNKFGNYAYRSLEGILAGVKPLLKETECTLTISDEIIELGGRFYVKATATLSFNGEQVSTTAFAREEENKKGMDGAQVTGAASSYARKYAANGLFAIDDTVDSDGSNTHGKEEEKAVKKPTKGKISDLNSVKSALAKDREGTIKILESKYELTDAQRKELGI